MSQNSEPPIEAAHREAEEGFGDASDEDAYDASDGEESPGPTRGGAPGIFMRDLADVLRRADLEVIEYDGWKTRGRRGGRGLVSGPHAIVIHHTASPPRMDGKGDAAFIAEGAGIAPISNLYLDRAGTWWVLAAGGANTNGAGGPWGPVPTGGANTRVIGIEAGNTGTGEAWPTAMQDSYVAGVAALAEHYDIETTNVLSHHEWAPRRKFDPIGPSRFGSINGVGTWDMNTFRNEVSAARNEERTARVIDPPLAPGDTYIVQAGDAWWPIADKTMGDPAANWLTLAEANGGPDRVLLAGAVLTIPAADGGSPAPSASSASSASAPSATAPDFPGEAKWGMSDDVVLAWQRALIEHGVIDDTAGNRDGRYGDGLYTTILELQQSWGWANADGVAGAGTWRRLHTGA